MAKNKVSEYSATAANNTDIGGINIAEGCAPSGINNAIRELMAQLKDMQSGTDVFGQNTTDIAKAEAKLKNINAYETYEELKAKMSDLNFSLLPWQQEVFADKTRFKVIAAGRRCGKSRLSAVTLLIEGLQCTAGSAVLYVAPTNGQARQIIWDVLMELGREVIQSSHINNMGIHGSN